MIILLTVIVAVAAVPLLYFVWMHSSRLSGRPADALIVLGYRCENDALHPLLKERLDTAIGLMNRHSYRCVIVSGGSVASKRSEAEIMKQYLLSQGIPPRLIVEESWSRNTVQNMVNCGLLMEERGLRTCLVVSNSFHIRRMKYIVKALGMKAMFYADRSPRAVFRQGKLTVQEIRAFRLTLPWLEKVSGMPRRELMGKNAARPANPKPVE
ncbi:YdcF family protein [Paenibacillus aurantius]|uniref:YdcF family protein n=1 Tax=Paenibacillus aurantius TaxID=2918900 RepID=A0AA96L990_9BACL|nr:YdcF family protein [Paenibacillus aurantius]WNQ09459.1 YdcF family protein [Paenibacillus aurantius]